MLLVGVPLARLELLRETESQRAAGLSTLIEMGVRRT
jgi:hypothetical protein